MANAKISALASGSPALSTDVYVIERSSTSNFKLTAAQMATFFWASPALVTPALDTPSAGVLTNCTGYPVASLANLGTGVATFLATPTSANLAAAVTNETGSGALVFATSPTITTPVLTGAITKTGQAAIVADSAAIANTETIVVQTAAALAAARLVAGTVIRATLCGTFTAVGAAAPVWKIRIGTAGTTGDTAAISATGPNSVIGTAIPFRVILEMTVRTVGASATCVGQYSHTNQGVTGLAATGANTVVGTPAAFDTTAADFVSVSFISGNASNSATFTQSFIEFVNL